MKLSFFKGRDPTGIISVVLRNVLHVLTIIAYTYIKHVLDTFKCAKREEICWSKRLLRKNKTVQTGYGIWSKSSYTL